ncbi:MAG: peptidoglycan-binding protein, partial [Minisyncoccia bacterium]
SPTDAIVVRTGNGTNSGIYIRTANPGGENFVYMHLSSIAPGIETGDKVLRGEIIGFVGNTGNASGGPAHLHFELRQGGSAMDPFPRLSTVFTRAEEEKSISDAQARGISISTALAQPAGTTSTPASASIVPANANLVFGETNGDVVTLQKFLILSSQGSAGTRLKNTGATGYFGTLTREALIEYQRSAGLSPSGVVDSATYAQIFTLQGEGDSSDTSEAGSVSPTFTRDLELGMSGADVVALQVFLNTKGFIVAASGIGSRGNESDYFGARTKAALATYQAANAIVPAAGYFGPKTRAFMAR